jgi:hypothetical protein
MLTVWLDEHWLDVDIKLVIPALLIFLVDRALAAEIAAPYGGYGWPAVLWLGVGWTGVTLVAAFVIDYFFRRAETPAAAGVEAE